MRGRSFLILALVSVLAAVACAPRDVGTTTVRSENEAESEDPHILPQWFIAELIAETERTRELPMQEDIDARTMTSEEVRTLIQGQVAEIDMTVAQRIMRAFGFIPEGLDLGQQMVDLLSEEVLGMYDPAQDQLIVLRRVVEGLGEASMEAMTARMVLVHELTHALQDQHFDTLEHTGEEVWSDDRQSVYSCLAEGDATLTMFVSSLSQKGMPVDPTLHPRFREVMRVQGESAIPQSSAMDEAPPYFRHVLTAIYLEGAAFVADLRRLGGWRAVDDAHRSPPRSTRDVLHTNYYLTGRGIFEFDLPATLPGLDDGGYERIASAVLGELESGAFLLPIDDPERLRRAQEGWAGDRFVVYESTDGELALVWRLRFEAVADAVEYFDAAHDAAVAAGRGPCEEEQAPSSVAEEQAEEATAQPCSEGAEGTECSSSSDSAASPGAPSVRPWSRVLCNEGRDLMLRRRADLVILRGVPAASAPSIVEMVVSAPSEAREVPPPQPELLPLLSDVDGG